MERFVTTIVQKRKFTAVEHGKNCPSKSQQVSETEIILKDATLESLSFVAQLTESLRLEVFPSQAAASLARALPLDHVEMLEAELRNQGILASGIKHPYSLVREARHECNVWRWRARRLGFDASKLDFEMSLPYYLVSHARQLLRDLEFAKDGTSRIGGQSLRQSYNKQQSLIRDLKQLDRWAAYLCGAFEDTKDRYQRGLNLVLKAIYLGARRDHCETRDTQFILTLPLEKKEFYEMLKNFKPKGVTPR